MWKVEYLKNGCKGDILNKLMGFYELKTLGIPTVKWEEFTYDTVLDNSMLWTLRTAKFRGSDYNLPRFVGITADKAMEEGRKLKQRLLDDGIVIYYPYFIAEKSGTIKIGLKDIVIEGTYNDLWNLVTYGKRDVTVIIREGLNSISGDHKFFDTKELNELLKYIKLLHTKYLYDIIQNVELYAEWSYARNSSIDAKPMGKRYLVFYELRMI